MQGYYQQPQMQMPGGGYGQMGPGMGMDPRMQQQQMMMMGGGGGGGMMGPQGGMMGGMNPMMGGGQMGPGMGMNGMQGGQAWRQLGYDYQLPTLGYKPETSWGAWDLANAQYSGNSLDRTFFDNILSRLTDFFSNRHLSEDAAREAHRRVYFHDQGADAGNKTLGGAAAYQAYLIWDRDHYSAYHSYPSNENRDRLCGLAVAELFRLWENVQPRSSRVTTEEAAQYAAATAKYLFDRHYDIGGHHRHGNRMSGYFADDDSDAGSDGRRMRRRSMYGNMGGYGGMQGGGPGMMGGGGGPGMMPGMMGPGMGMMHPGQGMGMGPGGPMGIMPGMGQMGGGMMGQNGLAMGMIPMGAGGGAMGIGESQAAPGMHPYTYGTQSGVAWGNQPIDQMGNPTYPGMQMGQMGMGRNMYGYGQPRYY